MEKRNMAHDAHGNGHLRGTATAPSVVGRHVLCRHAWTQVRRALDLSAKEYEVVLRVFDDMSENDIAADLDLSPHTVHSHLARIYHKAHVRSRVQLVIAVLTRFLENCEKVRCHDPRRGIP